MQRSRHRAETLRRSWALLALAPLFATAGCFGTTPLDHGDIYPERAGIAAGGIDEAELIEVRVILVAYSGAEGADEEMTRTENQAEARASVVAGLARAPEARFRQLSQLYSDVRDRPIRLTRESDELPAAVVEAAFQTGVGQTSGVVATEQGFFVIHREDNPPTGPTRVSARHILISFEGARGADDETTRSREAALALAQEIVELARTDPNDWENLAAEYSDDPGGEGGDLGSFGRGQMVPQFERAAFALAIGEISDPVESPFGFHVIQRYE